jgi:serine protease Do
LLYSQSGGNEGIGFAVPSSLVRVVFDQIRQHGRVVRADIGAETQTITPLLAGGWRLAQTWGVVISDIVEEGAAEQAGLRVGDIILSVNGKTMENARQFALTLYRPKPGETVRLVIVRGTEQIQVSIPLTEKLADPERFASLLTHGQTPIPQLGVLAVDLTSKLTDTMTALRGETGVLVAGRTSEAPVMEGAFKTGDVIYAINRERVTSIADVKTLLSRLKTGDPVVVQIERGGRLLFVALELP